MPQAEERRLRQEAHKAGIAPGSARERAYVYSTLRRIKEYRKRKRKEHHNGNESSGTTTVQQ